ncbi:MAG: response regulator [Desulfobacteraceae bacterium]|nr:response regulator [Desulfobacteraceae bacterium]
MDQDICALKTLIVEDFKTTRNMQVQVLKELGFRHIIEADNGETALQKIQEEPDIGLIISDWNMPCMNGYEFLSKLRSPGQSRRIPFIMATAQGEKSKALKAIETGADSFITKPFSPGELMAIIEDVLNRKTHSPAHPVISQHKKVKIDVAHIQITDHLILGVLKHLIDTKELSPRCFELNPLCMPSWNPVRNALEKGEVDAAFILSPLAMDIFSHGAPIKLILLTHKNGSICVRNYRTDKEMPLHDFFKSRIFYLPHIMSIHNMLSDMFLREIGLKLGPIGVKGVNIFYEVVSPVNMPEFLLKNPDSCGFVVAEPFGSKAIEAGISKLMFLSGELWENHPCCVVAMRNEFIDAHEDAVHEFVQMLVQAGQFITSQPETAARVAFDFLDPDGSLGLSRTLFHNILTQPFGIRTDDLFPVYEDLDKVQRYMNKEMGIGTIIDIEKFTDIRFAKAACKTGTSEIRPSKIRSAENIIAGMIRQQMSGKQEIPLNIRGDELEDIFKSIGNDTTITYLISSRMYLVDRAVHETRGFLKRLGFKAFSEFNLILRELLINAVEHGNQNTPSKTITCSVEHVRNLLFRIIVADQGNGFDYRKLDMSLPKDPCKPRKRGYPFIYAFSEKIEFNEKGNQITVYHNTYKDTDFNAQIDNGWCVIRASGNITATVTHKFGNLLKKLVQDGNMKFRFDLSEVQEIDSVGLSAFILLNKTLSKKRTKPDLEIMNASPEIISLFRMTNLDKAYRITGVTT